MKKLDVQLATDRTGEGAAMIAHARVVLTRANINAPWTDKTHFPTSDPPGWDCDKGKTLTGKTVRGPGAAAPVVARDYAR